MKNSTRKKFLAAAVVTLVIAAAVTATVVLTAGKEEMPPPENKIEAVKFVASKRFCTLSLEQQQEYLRQIGREGFREVRNMDEPDRRAFMKNMRTVRNAELNQRLDRFFKMSEAEQNAQLDRDIAEMQKRMAEFEKRRAERQARAANSPQGSQPERRQPPTAQQRRERDADMNPATRSKMQAYREKMRQRAAATGKKLR